ncbi:tumor necrosis factor receptor superfamily member 6 [Elysia marginata]|uniref:Tumor necrosis factor receptor superfamily member 6 n=1 Tax=Elysia marginata TaxID=1093978 RepID=A0AAV4ETT1_9GAST|nr:tumor necrosis factor receptor superfamily member 6 [Elysia marginata]
MSTQSSVRLLTLTLAALLCVEGRVHCGPGERLALGVAGQQDTCRPCSFGYYQDRLHHRHRLCKRCLIFDEYDPRMFLVSDCTRFHDTTVRCVDGFYVASDECQVCTNCSLLQKVQIRPCQQNQNAVCCETQIVRHGKCVTSI